METTQRPGSRDRDHVIGVIVMLKEQKETMGKQLKEINKKNEQNVNKEIEIIKRNQIKILDQEVQ